MRPAFVSPMKAVLTMERPAGPEWVFERKLDGIRCLAVKDGGRTRLYSRNELSLNDRYAGLAAALDSDPADGFVIDGEAVAFVGVSAGPWGGTRVIESMVPMVRELGLAVTFTDLHFPTVQSKFDDNGKLLDAAYENRVQGFLDELVWMSRTLKWGRANLPSKHHPSI